MSTNIIQDVLWNVPLFKELTREEIGAITEIAKIKQYATNSYVFMQGESLERVHFIHKGKVKIYKTDINGKEQIVSILKSEDMFPHAGFFRKGNYPAHAEIIESATLVEIPILAFEQLLLQYPSLSIKLFRVMGDIIVDLQKRLEEQVLHNTEEQIIMLLIRLSKTHGKQCTDKNMILTTRFTNQELANMIGSSRETVSRTINKLKREGLVKGTKGGYLLLDMDCLQYYDC